jgi:hypothetical protein
VCPALLVLEPGATLSLSAPAAARQLVVPSSSSVAVWRSECFAALSRAGRCFGPPWALVACVHCSQHDSSQHERGSESLRSAPAVMCCILSPDSCVSSLQKLGMLPYVMGYRAGYKAATSADGPGGKGYDAAYRTGMQVD